MSMSKAEFEAFAELVAKHRGFYVGGSPGRSAVELLAIEMTNIFAASNPEFDRHRFLMAVGMRNR